MNFLRSALTLLTLLTLATTAAADQLTIGLGTAPNDGTGDTLRTAFGKINTNFAELYATAGAGITNLTVGRTIYVDQVNGVNSTGSRGNAAKPFLSINWAKTNAQAGDTIIIGPGTYYEHDLLKKGVNYSFQPGATVNFQALTYPDQGIFDDRLIGATTNIISGWGNFVLTNISSATIGVLVVTNPLSTITFRANNVVVNNFGAGPDLAAIYILNCAYVVLDIDKLTDPIYGAATSGAIGVYWERGEVYAKVRFAKMDYGYAAWAHSPAGGTTNNLWWEGDYAESYGYNTFYLDTGVGELNPEYKLWVRAKEIRSQQGGVLNALRGGKVYIDSEKLTGYGPTTISASDSSIWINAQKLENGTGTLIHIDGAGRNFINVLQYSYTDIATVPAIDITGGTNEFFGGRLIVTNQPAVSVRGSTATRLSGMHITGVATSAGGNTNNPIIVNTNGLTLSGVKIFSPTGADAILNTNAAAITVTIDSAIHVNTALQTTNITFSGNTNWLAGDLYSINSLYIPTDLSKIQIGANTPVVTRVGVGLYRTVTNSGNLNAFYTEDQIQKASGQYRSFYSGPTVLNSGMTFLQNFVAAPNLNTNNCRISNIYEFQGAIGGTGTNCQVDDLYGFVLTAPTFNGTITNYYAILVDTLGATTIITNYGVSVAAGYLNGFGTKFPRYQLEVANGLIASAGITNGGGFTNSGPIVPLQITPSRAASYDANGVLTNSTVTATEQGYLSGVTSALQTQIDSKNGSLTWKTNGTQIASAPTTVNFTTGLTGSVSGAILTVGINASGGSGGPTTSNSIPAALTLLTTSASSNCYMADLNVGTYFPVIATNQWGLLFTNGSHTEGFTVDIFQGTLGNWTGVLLNNTGGSQTNRVGFGTDITAITTTTNSLSWDRFRGIFLAGVAGAPNTTNKIDIVGFVRGYQ